MKLSDEALLTRIGRHDAEAFEVFFTRHRERVYRHLMRMVREADTAEDLIQEVFLRVWQRGEQWDGRGACTAWLLRIATNLALNQFRTLRRRREIPLEAPSAGFDEEDSPAPGWMVDAAAHGPDALCEQAEQQQALQRLVDTLPEEKRQVIRLVHEAEMDLHEVAAILGIPEGTVKSRLFYARKQLARDLNDMERD
ncbi:MAG: RNA polymerase sigma factor [Armatimonadota bacterium]